MKTRISSLRQSRRDCPKPVNFARAGLSLSPHEAAAPPRRQRRTSAHPSWRRRAHIRVHLGGASVGRSPAPRAHPAPPIGRRRVRPHPPPGGGGGSRRRRRRARSGGGRGAGMSELRQRLGREPGGAQEPEEKVRAGGAAGGGRAAAGRRGAGSGGGARGLRGLRSAGDPPPPPAGAAAVPPGPPRTPRLCWCSAAWRLVYLLPTPPKPAPNERSPAGGGLCPALGNRARIPLPGTWDRGINWTYGISGGGYEPLREDFGVS